MGKASVWFNMTATYNSVKKNHYYLNKVFDRTWAILSHLYGDEELKQMGFQQDFGQSKTPAKKFKKVEVPPLVPSSYSSSHDTDENEDLDDTVAGPSPTNDPNNTNTPSSTS